MAYANEPTMVIDASDSPPRAGAVLLGRYTLRSLIGSGGTADVWAARDEKRGSMVTIKLLRDRQDPDTRRRFLDEGLWLEAIEHPAVVRALGRHDVMGLTLIVFEHVQGMTLAERLKERPPSPREAAAMVRDLGGALGALHAHGVLHMDLKPANIIVGDDAKVRLIDLGIADLIGNSPEVIRGTPAWVAPEVRDGQAPTRATDVYGLALIARELLGEVAHDPRVAFVLKFGLDIDPTKRPSSARRFALALSAAVLAREAGGWLRDRIAGLRSRVGRDAVPLAHKLEDRARRSAERARAEAAAIVELRPRDLRPDTIADSVRAMGQRLRAAGQPIIYLGVAAILVAILLAVPRVSSAPSASPARTPSPSAVARPPLSAYAAAFEWESPFPTVAPGAQIDWFIALKNTGTAVWLADAEGARAIVAHSDGTLAGRQLNPQVKPGEVGMFHVRFAAPATPGTHRYPLRLVIEGTGRTPDIGLYLDVDVRR